MHPSSKNFLASVQKKAQGAQAQFLCVVRNKKKFLIYFWKIQYPLISLSYFFSVLFFVKAVLQPNS